MVQEELRTSLAFCSMQCTTDQALRPHMGIFSSLERLPHSYSDLCTAIISSHGSSASNVCSPDGTLPTGKSNYAGKLLLTGSRLDGGKADAANTVAIVIRDMCNFPSSQHTPAKQSTGRRHRPSCHCGGMKSQEVDPTGSSFVHSTFCDTGKT